ncbi:MAG: hypothetical protein K6B70_03850 [Clostridia bacterium]|nr:hypothetical protein [Clostridia bacterium]
MKLLSNEVIGKYDYQKTRSKVNEFMEEFEENYFRYISILPPSITSHLSEIKVQSSMSSTSALERYVIQKLDLEAEFLNHLELVMKIVEGLTYEEHHYFKGVFFLGNSESMIMEELQCAEKRLRHVKKSCILKFALALDLAIVK